MRTQSRSPVQLLLRSAVLFLAVAIVNWGLQARISVIQAHRSSTKLAARFSGEEPSSRASNAPPISLDPREPSDLSHTFTAVLLFQGHAVPLSGVPHPAPIGNDPRHSPALAPQRIDLPPPARA